MNCRGSRMLSLVTAPLAVALLLGVGASTARADEPWLFTGSLSLSTSLNEPYRDSFGLGGAADVGLYRPLTPWLLVGGRLGGVLLSQDHELGQPSDDHGMFTMARLAVVARLRPLAVGSLDERRSTGLWLEGGVGPGLAETDSHLYPVLEAAVGYGFDLGAVTIGPVFRYQQVVEAEGPFGGHDARLASLGVEATFGDVTPRPAQVVTGWVAERDDDADGDGILDAFDRCPNEPETYNGINDHDGCPDTATVALVDNRIVVDETVFFDFDESVVSARGRARLAEIHSLCDENRCQLARVEGHADSRGSDSYNLALGTRRANAVRDVLIELGQSGDAMIAVSYGESEPIYVAAHTEAQHALNRRVEFVVTPMTVSEVD